MARTLAHGERRRSADLHATEIVDLVLSGDLLARTLLDQTATTFVQAIYNLRMVLNCALFVIGGAVGLHPALSDAAQRLLEQWTGPQDPRLFRSTLGTDAQLLGAALRVALKSERARSTA